MNKKLLKEIEELAVDITDIKVDGEYETTTYDGKTKQVNKATPLGIAQHCAEAIIDKIGGRDPEEEVLLTVDQIHDLASKQGDVITDLQLFKVVLSHLTVTNNRETEDAIDLLHSKVQQMIKDLDDTTFALYNITNGNELKAMGLLAQDDSEVEDNE